MAILTIIVVTSRRTAKNIRAAEEKDIRQDEEFKRKLKEKRAEQAQKKALEGPSSVETPQQPSIEPPEGSDDIEIVTKRETVGMAFELADNAFAAFDNGNIIEAYYYGRLAQHMGHRQLARFLANVRIVWKRIGYPDQKELIDQMFDETQSAIGRALIRIDSRHDAQAGIAKLKELAEDGNELARDFLEKSI